MASNSTLLAKLINPEVMGDMVSYELEKKLRLTGFTRVDRTLVGRAGDTITIPSWKYIGAAEIVPEDTQVPSRQMNTEDISYTVKKAALEVTLTDEAVLSGYSDPVGETTKQLRLAIQERIEMDGTALLESITEENGHVYTSTENIGYLPIVGAIDLFNAEEQGEELFILMNSKNVTQIRKDPKFYERATATGDRVFVTGAIGSIAGVQVVISNRVRDTDAYILTRDALTLFLKRDINLETEREMSFKRTKIGSDAHYVVAIEDFDKIVAMRVKAPTATK